MGIHISSSESGCSFLYSSHSISKCGLLSNIYPEAGSHCPKIYWNVLMPVLAGPLCKNAAWKPTRQGYCLHTWGYMRKISYLSCRPFFKLSVKFKLNKIQRAVKAWNTSCCLRHWLFLFGGAWSCVISFIAGKRHFHAVAHEHFCGGGFQPVFHSLAFCVNFYVVFR